MANKKTHEQYLEEVQLLDDDIEVIGKYVGAHKHIAHRCKICGYGNNGEWTPAPTDILSGHGCPVCATTPRKIGPAPEYKNSIWTSEYKGFFAQYLSEEQMKMIMPMSNKKIGIQCPNCGSVKNTSPNNLFHNGFCCDKCSDGVSYPEKFMMSLLNQLHIDYHKEYSPNWANGKIYDFYLSDYNCIVETHGIQHYEASNRGRNLTKEQANDLYKKELAMQNGISYYYVIDCRYSNLEWIKSHIISSGLLNLFDVINNDIDWNLCSREAISSKVIVAANLWNMGKPMSEIIEITKLTKTTIRAYLIKASNVGLCNYNKDESRKRMRESELYHYRLSESHKGKCIGKHHPNAKPVVQLDKKLNVISIWDTATCAEDGTGVDHSRIAACCRFKIKSAGGYIWRYVYDQIDKQNNRICGALTLNLISLEELTAQN